MVYLLRELQSVGADGEFVTTIHRPKKGSLSQASRAPTESFRELVEKGVRLGIRRGPAA